MRQRATLFVADAMLGSLARKLRAFGFDTVYYSKGDDGGIMTLARRETRVLLTADRTLHSRASSAGLCVLLITGQTDGRRVSSLLARARGAGVKLVRGAPFCSTCGGTLDMVSQKEAESLVPRGVALRHRLFNRCSTCGRVYWRGRHWKKLRHLERAFGPRKTSSGDS